RKIGSRSKGLMTAKRHRLLGDHRLYCGSALDPTAYDILLGTAKAAAVFTDPPYNVKLDGHICGSGAIKHRELAGEMTEDEFTRFLSETLELAGSHAPGGAIVYACMDWRHMGEMLATGRAIGLDLLNLCVWVKCNGGMVSLYRSRHELVFVFRNGKEAHLNNVQLGRFGRNRTNVWNYAGTNSFPRKGQASALDLHPTVKPIAMVSDAILDSTKRDDIVLDPFCGSGTPPERLSQTSKPSGESHHESPAEGLRGRLQTAATTYPMEKGTMRQSEAAI